MEKNNIRDTGEWCPGSKKREWTRLAAQRGKEKRKKKRAARKCKQSLKRGSAEKHHVSY